MPSLSYFTVNDSSYEGVQTNTTTTGGSAPTVGFISGTVTFTPSVTEIDGQPLGATVLLDPIHGRFSSDDGVLRSLNGTTGVGLVDNVGLGLAEGQLSYVVTYTNVNFDGLDERQIASFRFAAPGNGDAVDLNTVARLPV